MILGAPADVAGFSFLQCLLAQKLGVKPGIYTHSISNAHIYDIHYEAAEEIIKRQHDHKKITLSLPDRAFERAESRDKNLYQEIVHDLEKQYHPGEPIRGLKIVL